MRLIDFDIILLKIFITISSLFKTGFLSISSRVAYLAANSVGIPEVYCSDLQDVKGMAVVAIPPVIAVEINVRLFVFIMQVLALTLGIGNAEWIYYLFP